MIDASALIKYLFKEPGYEAIERYLITGVCSVDHLVKEASNAIWKHAVLHKRISKKDARDLYVALSKLIEGRVIVIEPQERYTHQAFEIALNHEITIYDALYIAQSKTNHTKLITSDRKQANIARELGVTVQLV
ncbi:MAG: type II toxin-antitoxin system VapC family toxin [Zestosphaera sp.]